MPSLSSIVERFTNQDIVYWEHDGDNASGKPSYKTPITLKVRWEDRFQEILTRDGRTVLSKGYILAADRLVEGSIIWQGTLLTWAAQSYYPSIPTVNQGGSEVMVTNTTPGIPQLPGNVYESYL